MNHFAIKGLALAILLTSTLGAATINQRRENQQDRIAQGVRSGQLTARETGGLENKEARLNRQIRNDRMDHNGHLTGGERAQINHEQNHLSRDIYRDKHNAWRQ
jgi:hypothetical protein